MTLLPQIAWAFNSNDYATPEAFSKAISGYQQRIMKERACWEPGEIVISHPSVRIAYEYYTTGHNELFDDEEGEEDTEEEEGEEEQRNVVLTLKADNGQYITALELLYKLHQRLRQRELGDHIFFEGLSCFNDSEKMSPPLYYLNCGS